MENGESLEAEVLIDLFTYLFVDLRLLEFAKEVREGDSFFLFQLIFDFTYILSVILIRECSTLSEYL